ncbi:uncharacterized protein LOC114535158 [Dendronephthya gigantea]|uniref:uncharacterized protein LOC114535158 n=1 Tax=Dendronephthya gigantea TaxID=151771 RepID=UPI00106C08AF|nr:uncharacterized protein LOC114535158 [Dendronephthya gigantea]
MPFNESQRSALLTYFNNGMTGVGEKYAEKINAAVAETGLSEKQVKNWITKMVYKSKPNPKNKRSIANTSDASGNSSHDVIPRRKRAKSSWNLFQKEFASSEEGKELMSNCGVSSFNKTAAERFQNLSEEAKSHLVLDHVEDVLTEPQRAKIVTDIFSKVRNNTCKRLEEHGCPAFMIGFRNNKILFAGSHNIEAKLRDETIKMIHEDIFTKEADSSETSKQEEDRLRKEVQSLFNQKYQQETGEKGRLPYKRLAEFDAQCLPEGITLKKPSAYGTAQLKKIVECKDQIRIRKKDDIFHDNFFDNQFNGDDLLPDPTNTSSALQDPTNTSSAPQDPPNTSSFCPPRPNQPSSALQDPPNTSSALQDPTNTSSALQDPTNTSSAPQDPPNTSSTPQDPPNTSSALQDPTNTSSALQDPTNTNTTLLHPTGDHHPSNRPKSLTYREYVKWRSTRPKIKILPFWTKVNILDRYASDSGRVVGEGIVVPGFQAHDEPVSLHRGLCRKVYVEKVYECNKDIHMVTGSYIACSFVRLTPKDADCPEEVGGLIDSKLAGGFRKLKGKKDEEELCEALACQCPTSEDIGWAQCGTCEKWYHLHCIGVLTEDQVPERWCCGMETINSEEVFEFRKKGQYQNLGEMLHVLKTVQEHLKMLVTNKISSVRHRIFMKYKKKESGALLKKLSAGTKSPFTEELDEDFMDIVHGMFMPPEREYEDMWKLQYVTDVLIPEAYVWFVMEVENVPRNLAEIMLFNWTHQVPDILQQFRQSH